MIVKDYFIITSQLFRQFTTSWLLFKRLIKNHQNSRFKKIFKYKGLQKHANI